jgi:adenylate cyclase
MSGRPGPTLERILLRNRRVAPMVSALLAGVGVPLRIIDVDERAILVRGEEAGAIDAERFPITVAGEPVGWVEGPRQARAIAAVIGYAVAREIDARSLADEALERYRELALIYDLAATLGTRLDVEAVAETAREEIGRLPAGGVPFVLLTEGDGRLLDPGERGAAPGQHVGDGIIGAVASSGSAELVNEPAADPRASAWERGQGAIICAPLRSEGSTIGVLGLAGALGTEYLAADLKLVTAIASLTGPALALAREHSAALQQAAVREIELQRRLARFHGEAPVPPAE